MITNNVDFYTYMKNKGVWCTYFKTPPKTKAGNELIVVFTNNCHALSICGNRFNNEKKEDFESEATELLDWLDCGNRVIIISNVIKFGTPYMAENFEALQQRYDKHNIVKQVLNTKDIGQLIVPHRIQIRYKGVKQIDFDIVATNNLEDPCHYWYDVNAGYMKKQQVHYLNVLNDSADTLTRRKQRYVPEYSLFSQLYKKLYTK